MSFLVIDGNSILNRAFYGIRILTNKDGIPTNAVTGFLNTLLMLKKDLNPDKIAVAFDLRAPTFRHKMYDGYKAGRKGMPEELAQQLPFTKKLIEALGIRIVEAEGYEADDIIGTISRICSEKGEQCYISTGDRDSFQLVADKVTVRLAKTKGDIIYTPDVIMEEYGVTPRQMIEVKALMGDSSDNIPGVPGIGEKTALMLIKEFGTVENLYRNTDSDKIKAGVRAKLISGKESCEMSRKLAEICLTAPIDENLSDYIPKPMDKDMTALILSRLEMYSALKKLGLKPVFAPDEEKKEADSAIFSGTDGVQLENGVWGLIIDNKLFAGELSAPAEISAKDMAESAESINYTFNIKELLTLSGCQSMPNVRFDATLAAYLLNPDSSDYSYQRLCAEYGIPTGNTPQEIFIASAELGNRLYTKLSRENGVDLLRDIEIPLAEVLVSMEKLGIKLDIEGIKSFGEMLDSEIEKSAAKIYTLAGREFNIASPKQLGDILFEDLALPYPKKSKGKRGYSTNAEILEGIYDMHPIVAEVLNWRGLTKLSGTYVTGLLKVVGDDGRIHSTFKQTETRTGRISSADPNIQNIPVRTELGKEMRKFFVAGEGNVLVDADYSQIELRVLAHISGDKIMIDAFNHNTDIHAVTASQVFNQPIEWVTNEMRGRAKAVNFGIVYGIGAFSLAKDIGVTLPQADRYIKDYLAKYSGVAAYMKNVVENAEKDGYVTTMFGRRRYIRELSASNKTLKALGRRIAMNTPVQGTAADIIKIAMIKVYKRLKAEYPDAKLILQVHDELIAEAPEQQASDIAAMIKEEMENAVKLSVPLIADVKCGKSWHETH